MITRLFALLLCITSLLIQCTTTTLAGGSDSPDFKVTGKVQNVDGTPLKNAIVTILPQSFNPITDRAADSWMVDTTDTNGVYTLGVTQSGIYAVCATDPVKKTKCLVNNIAVADSSTLVATEIVAPCGSIALTLPASQFAGTDAYVYIPGTRIFLFCNDQSETILIDSVPKGVLPKIVYSTLSAPVQSLVLRYGIHIEASSITKVMYTDWKQSNELTLNTTSSGANISSTLTHFPVLVRLTEANFDFTGTHSVGKDLIFTKDDTTRLPLTIERWDSIAGLAEVWVTVDTLYGNSNSQRLRFYWDNPKISETVVKSSPFDTAHGFCGVWHLGDNIKSTLKVYDNTQNNYTGTVYGMTSGISVDGMIGKAISFDGIDDYIDAGSVAIPSTYTLSAWVKVDTSGAAQRFIFRDSSYTLWYDNRDTAGIRVEHMSDAAWWRGIRQDGGTFVPLLKDQWYYIAGSYDGTNIRLYVNGTEVSRSNAVTTPPVNSLASVVFGRYHTSDYVNGIMDEIRIERTARSADWILLNYMNQRSDDKLVRIK